jgi:hypothetical protein
MNETLEALKIIQWLFGNNMLTDEEEVLLKGLAFDAPAATTNQVLEALKEAQWLAGNKRLTAGELARLKDLILAPYRSAPAPRWEYLVVAWGEPGPVGSDGPAALQASLGTYGAEGWELTGIVAPPGASGQAWLVFKRPGRPV